MNSRDLIHRVITFNGPERIGMSFDRGRMNDIVGGGIAPAPGWSDRRHVEGNLEIWFDEWGNQWHRIIGLSIGGEVREPVLKNWKDLDTLKLPNFADPVRYEAAKKNFSAHPEKFHLGSLPGFPFAIMRYMRKMEIFLADVLEHRDEVEELQRRVLALLKTVIRNMAQAGADAVFACEDWGTQERLLVSPKLWRELFKPGFAELVAEAESYGMGVWMHSCGYVYDIIGDLIEVGIQVLQFDQPRLNGIERMGREFGGKVTFWCPVDIQRTLQTGDREQIRAEAKLLIEYLGGSGGGFIAKNYGDLHGIGVKQEWDDWAYEAFVEYGRY